MQGIRGFAPNLSDYIDSLPEDDLPRVARNALMVVRQDYVDSPAICSAIDKFLQGAYPDQHFAEQLQRLSERCDADYIKLENDGHLAESTAAYRQMCVLFALSQLFSTGRMTHKRIDSVLYDIAGASPDLSRLSRDIEIAARKSE